MNNYGIEIFNSLGELVFSSDKRTVQVLQAGTVSLTKGAPYTRWVEFPPVTERPQIYAQTTGEYYVAATNFPYWNSGAMKYYYDVYYDDFVPFTGVFEQNENGQYYRVAFITALVYSRYMGRYPLEKPDPGGTSFKIPYVIFV